MLISERIIMEDFQRLCRNHPLADLSLDIRDYRLSNGEIGELVVYTMTETLGRGGVDYSAKGR